MTARETDAKTNYNVFNYFRYLHRFHCLCGGRIVRYSPIVVSFPILCYNSPEPLGMEGALKLHRLAMPGSE